MSGFDESVILRDPEVLENYRRDVSGLIGDPEGLVRPENLDEICRLMRWAGPVGLSVLPVGARTSTTGSSVAADGLVIDLVRLRTSPELDAGKHRVRVCANQNLGDLQSFLRGEGFDLPPDPTSAGDCTVGGAVATNASGPSTFRYGSIRNFVEELVLVDGKGEIRRLKRSCVDKNAMGPVALQEPLDLFIGSEGIFGTIVELVLRVIDVREQRAGVFIGFDSRKGLFEGVGALRALARTQRIRSIEWLNQSSCALVRPHQGRLSIGETPGGGLYIEVEGNESEMMTSFEAILEAVVPHGGREDDAQVLMDRSSLAAFGELRHRIPDTMNRMGAAAQARAGGGKVSTDWSVPVTELENIMVWTERELGGIELDAFVAYGHIGNGHPHLNFVCPDDETKASVHALIGRQLKQVVQCGGVPTSEHGIGKIKRDLVVPYLPVGFISAIQGLKAEFDPYGILGRGNLVTLPGS